MKYFFYIINIIKSFFFDLYYYFFENLAQRKGAYSYNTYKSNKYYSDYIKQGAAIEGVKYLAQKYCKGKGVDIGASEWSLDGSKPIEDNNEENAYKILEEDESLDYVFSSHLLEHLSEPLKAIDVWRKKLKSGGILFLYLPHPSCHMWKKNNLKYHIWNPDPYYLEELFDNSDDFNIVNISYLPDGYMSFVCIVKKK
jgi:SAM-dependent methyltransferase